MADDNSDSAKRSFWKSITVMKIICKNLAFQQISLSHWIFGELQFMLEMLLSKQIWSLTSTSNHHITCLLAPMSRDPTQASLHKDDWINNWSSTQNAVTTQIESLSHWASRSHALSLNLSGFHHGFTLRAQRSMFDIWSTVQTAQLDVLQAVKVCTVFYIQMALTDYNEMKNH